MLRHDWSYACSPAGLYRRLRYINFKFLIGAQQSQSVIEKYMMMLLLTHALDYPCNFQMDNQKVNATIHRVSICKYTALMLILSSAFQVLLMALMVVFRSSFWALMACELGRKFFAVGTFNTAYKLMKTTVQLQYSVLEQEEIISEIGRAVCLTLNFMWSLTTVGIAVQIWCSKPATVEVEDADATNVLVSADPSAAREDGIVVPGAPTPGVIVLSPGGGASADPHHQVEKEKTEIKRPSFRSAWQMNIWQILFALLYSSFLIHAHPRQFYSGYFPAIALGLIILSLFLYPFFSKFLTQSAMDSLYFGFLAAIIGIGGNVVKLFGAG
uniref:Uncharacterized protein n=1 Tax=Chromera velia CCMP2878 TaxID=1169474 RepID=A0A0G4H4Z3_9ALVE|eukprot:Cvel_5703.t1-p1 / transcript=Cvel_5703.t1 / gene=Cvel_5703 / organism=Chromera_velia_CCMP2878 / gene_product=hypothetical protein / transcript_product=hypothetical protein / location=Cvel_scaffold270:785-8996(-) / protein_length=326 / sequence_SO=supercontig / SO=protein_coding / is_pseudo=false